MNSRSNSSFRGLASSLALSGLVVTLAVAQGYAAQSPKGDGDLRDVIQARIDGSETTPDRKAMLQALLKRDVDSRDEFESRLRLLKHRVSSLAKQGDSPALAAARVEHGLVEDVLLEQQQLDLRDLIDQLASVGIPSSAVVPAVAQLGEMAQAIDAGGKVSDAQYVKLLQILEGGGLPRIEASVKALREHDRSVGILKSAK